MRKIPIILLITIFALLSTVNITMAIPLDLNLTKKYNMVPEVEGFRYWYGDISWGKVIYLGKEDLAGFQTELHLDFSSKLITTALLILGPAGLDDENCIIEYERITRLINKKYGHFKYKIVEKDPIMDDLIAFSACHPISVGLYTISTIWKLNAVKITSVLIGDDEGFTIEIEYKFRPKIKRKTKKLLKVL